MSTAHTPGRGADRPPGAPTVNLATLAAKIADFLTGPAGDFHLLKAELIDPRHVRYTIAAADGGTLEMTITDPVTSETGGTR